MVILPTNDYILFVNTTKSPRNKPFSEATVYRFSTSSKITRKKKVRNQNTNQIKCCFV